MKYTAEEIKQHRAEWVAALRSGKYKQTQGNLHDDVGYCCLGVACELAGIRRTTRFIGGWVRYEGEASTLPLGAQEWLGVKTDDPHGSDDGVYSAMNDASVPFEQIADHFEQYGFHSSIDVLAGAEE